MSNKMPFTYARLVACLVFVTAPSARAEEYEYKNYWEYPEWKILQSRSMDGDDLEEIARFRQLAERGEAMHEAMLAVLWQRNDWLYSGLALDMLYVSKGDKSKVWPELRRLLAARLPHATGSLGDGPTEYCCCVSKMLAENGTEEDIKALLPVLSHPTSLLRYVAAKYLGEYGNESTLEILEAAKDGDYTPEVRRGFEEAIEAIKSRLSGRPAN